MATSDFLSPEQLQAMMEHRFGTSYGEDTSDISGMAETSVWKNPRYDTTEVFREGKDYLDMPFVQQHPEYYKRPGTYPWDQSQMRSGSISDAPVDPLDPSVHERYPGTTTSQLWDPERNPAMKHYSHIFDKGVPPTGGVYSGRADENYPNVSESQVPDFMWSSPQFREGLDNSMYGGDTSLIGSTDDINYYTGDTPPKDHPPFRVGDDGITRYDFDKQVPQQEDFRLDVGKSFPINANVPKPGPTWGFGIPAAFMNVGRRLKGSPYYSEKFPKRTFTEGDQTYTQQGLGGHYTPDELFNMQQFGGVGERDPRVDQFGKNIVSFADDYEEGIEDWIAKYGTRKSKDKGFLKRQADKINMWNQIQNRNKRRQVQNQRAHEEQMRRSGMEVGRPGAFEDLGTRDRGGQGAFKEDVAKMRGAARSYRDAKGNVGYSSGRATGGLIRTGYNQGGRVGILSLL